jgi:hypothetical protein
VGAGSSASSRSSNADIQLICGQSMVGGRRDLINKLLWETKFMPHCHICWIIHIIFRCRWKFDWLLRNDPNRTGAFLICDMASWHSFSDFIGYKDSRWILSEFIQQFGLVPSWIFSGPWDFLLLFRTWNLSQLRLDNCSESTFISHMFK